MIPDVDAALRSLIEGAGGTRDVEVVFDAPTKEWAARRSSPTVDVYLYDIREDLRRRERGLVNEYGDGRVIARHLPARHFKLSYLITAWTQRPEDEHRLLASLLQLFLGHDAIPAEHLSGSLATLGLAVPVTIALPPPEDRSFADVWSALGGELKPSLDLVVSAPVDTGRSYQAGPPVSAPVRPLMSGADGSTVQDQRGDVARLVREGAFLPAARPGSSGSASEPASKQPSGASRTPRTRSRRRKSSP
ncbi:MAG: DUF4255 domain-containing protein [Actinomycetales bacterium]